MRSVLVLATFLTAFGLGLAYAGWALVCRGDECPSIDVLEDERRESGQSHRHFP